MKVIKEILLPSTGGFDLKRTLKDIPCLFSTVNARHFSTAMLITYMLLVTPTLYFYDQVNELPLLFIEKTCEQLG